MNGGGDGNKDYEITFDCSRVVVGGLTYDRRLLYRVNNILSAEVNMPASVEMIAMGRSDQTQPTFKWIGLTWFGIAVKHSPFCMNKESHYWDSKTEAGHVDVSRRLYLGSKGVSLELAKAPSSKKQERYSFET